MDTLYIENLRVETVIGVFDWEREIPQTVRIDLSIGTDISKAAQSDDISDALNYKLIVKRLTTLIAESEHFLIETLAQNICKTVCDEFGAKWLRLKISKPGAVRNTSDVGLIIERGARK